MKFNVFYSLEKDIWNHLNSNWKFTYRKHGREDIQEKLLALYPKSFQDALKATKTEKKARAVIINFLSSLPKSFHNTTPLVARGVEQVLKENKEKIIGKLEAVYNKPFPFKTITVYLTTANICPYNFKKQWYMSGRNSNIENHISTALHELNHFMFYYYYSGLKKELGIEKYEILKEGLAVFTNPEGNDKPKVKNLENYLKKNLKRTIPKVLEKEEWKKYI